MLSVCPPLGMGVTPSPSCNTSTGSMSFLGVSQWMVQCPFLWGYPSPKQGVTPGWGTPSQVRIGYPVPGHVGVPPYQVRLRSPTCQVRLESPPARSGSGFPQPGQVQVPLCHVRLGYPACQVRIRYPSPWERTAEQAIAAWWAVCLFAFTQKNFLVFPKCK